MPRLRADDLRVKQLILTILESIAPQLEPGEVLRLHPQVKAGEVQVIFSYSAAGIDRRTDRRLPESMAMLPLLARTPAGLGIALAKLLIALHQGSLEIKTLPDRTTTITVRFPKARVM